MLAAYHGHSELVKLLMQHGADPNRLNDRGQSPLAGALFKKEDAVIEVSTSKFPAMIVTHMLTGVAGSSRRGCRSRLWLSLGDAGN